jgi:prophage regulatory protein
MATTKTRKRDEAHEREVEVAMRTSARRQAEAERVQLESEAMLKAARERAEAERRRVLVTFSELADLGVLLGEPQIARLEEQGLFPKRVPVSANRKAWVRAEVVEHVQKRIAARETVTPRPMPPGARRRQAHQGA